MRTDPLIQRELNAFTSLALLVAAGVLFVTAATSRGQDTPLPVDPFADVADLWRLTYPMTGSTGQTSSYDRTGGNGDAIFWYYQRPEPKRVVMADVRGPGCINRIWVTAFDADVARIEIFIDGGATPVVSAMMSTFFGNMAPFVPPLATPSTGAWVSYVPIPYRKSCRIEAVNARHDNNTIYYNVSYRTYQPGEQLADVFHMPPTSAQQTQLNLLAQQWNNRGQDPKTVQAGQQTLTGSVSANSGGTATLANLAGAGVISGIKLNFNPYIGDLLANARIRCKFDGAGSYQVDAPLGALFGSYFGPTDYLGRSAEVNALTFGNPNGQMFFFLPMPYSNGAVIDIVDNSFAGINVNYTITYVPKTAAQIGRYRFHADARSRTCGGGSPSYRILDVLGKGHFLGCVLGINFNDPNVGCLEGDEYFYVNGENYASIRGTGTEDYFNGGFYYSGGPVSLPFSGCSKIQQSYPLQASMYRLSIPDAVVFRNGFIADIEHGGVNEGNGTYYSTALFYRDDGPGNPPADPVNPPLTAGALTNSDFESSFGGYNGGEANGWMAYQSRAYYGNTGCTFSTATDQVYSGSKSQKVSIAGLAAGNLAAGIAQQVQVARGSSYQVTAHLRLSLAGTLQVGDVVPRLGLNPAGTTYHEDGSITWTNAPTAVNTWHTVTAIATATTDFLTIFLDGSLGPAGRVGPATLWIDSVIIAPYTGPLPPPPLPAIDNASFESGVSPWGMWLGSGSNSDGLEVDTGGIDGSRVLALKGIGTGGKGAWLFVGNNWVTGRQYRLSASVHNQSNSGMRYSIGHAIGNTGAGGVTGATFGTEVNGSSSWQTVSDTFTFTGTNEGLTIFLKVVNAGASERAGFDRVIVEDVTPAGSPAILRTPSSITRSVTQGSNLSNDTFTVQNSGGGTLNYAIADNVGWLSVNPTSGNSTGEADSITITYSTASLAVGTYNGTITITDAGATNSPQTIAVTVNVQTPGAPPAPTGLTATAGNAQVNLSWTVSSGATSYNVKRSTTSGSGYATIGSPAGTTYTDSTVTNGTTYYYVVTAVGGSGESSNSNEASATPSTGGATENFGTMPAWASTWDASWGGTATWAIVAGGQSGNCLQASRAGTGSGTRALVYNILANTNYTLSIYMRCPAGSATYWAESGYRLGSYSAQDFDENWTAWTTIIKFADTGPNGNGDAWTQYSVTFNSGSNTQVSAGTKLGASAGTGPVVKWDTLLLQAGATPPAIQLSPASLSTSVTAGGNPAAQSFTVRNSGGGTLSYNISDNAAWLSVNPASGTSTGETDTITVNYSTASLAASTYNATITVTDVSASNSPQTVGVSLTVNPAPIPPTIARSPASFSHNVVQGNNLANDTFTVQNTGGGTLSYTISESLSWLSVTPVSGTSTGEVDSIFIVYSTASLTPGTYSGTISIADGNAANTPQTIAVALTVQASSVPADFDGDQDVDLSDFGHLQLCLTGGNVEVTDPACMDAKLDGDTDVDIDDLNLFIGCMSGPGVAGSPTCIP